MVNPIEIMLIHQLIGRYGHLLDARDWERFGDLFVENATIDYRSSTGRVERSGRESVVEWFRGVAHPAAHHVTNIVVDERSDADVAVHSKFFAPYSRAEHNPKRMYGGDYHDVVRKTDRGWCFVSKQCLPTWNLAVVVDDAAPEHRRTF